MLQALTFLTHSRSGRAGWLTHQCPYVSHILASCYHLPQIHDELVFEVEAAALPAVAARVRGVLEGMAAAHRLRVPLPVKMGAGPSWGELAEYEP